MTGRAEIEARLADAGSRPDEALDIAETALLLAALDRPGVGLDHYRRHLGELAADAAEAGFGATTAAGRARALAEVLHRRHGYAGDNLTYDDTQNANLMRVIDRRKGLPVALGILYLHAARTQGWPMHGLNFPGHFLLRLQAGPERAVIDPFGEGRVLEAPEMRQLLKRAAGEQAELAAEHYAPVGSRDVLVRLQNNIKTRALQARQYRRAVEVLRSITLVAPAHAPAWRETGLLQAHLGNLQSAIAAIERYGECAADARGRGDAANILQQLRARLN